MQEINHVIETAKKIKAQPTEFQDICRGKILATLFYEPSTRTKLSFESAMLRMGGSVLGFSDANTSSVSKGESIADTIRVMSSYADIAVMRHPQEGSAKLAAQYATIPIINGGDGGHQHPTQTLTDLLTISQLRGSLDGHTIAFCGDLKFGRTVHSLIRTMIRYNTRKFILISPEELTLPATLQQFLCENSQVAMEECRYLEEGIGEADILYMTRIQKERFFNEADYQRLKDSYVLDARKMELAKSDLLVMHPLPRVNEIAYEVDDDPRAVYFQQAALGVFVRMALMALQLGVIA
jgi:aspartate carbamoyltransferase catalytic subunit